MDTPLIDKAAQAIRDIADELGLPPEKINRPLLRKHMTDRYLLNQISRHRLLPAARAKAAGQETGVLPIPDGQQIKSVSTLLSADGSTKAQWIKTEKAGPEPVADVIARISERLNLALPEPQEQSVGLPPDANSHLMSVIPIGDMHFGMRARKSENGEEDWDLDKSVELHRLAMRELITQGPTSAQCLIINLGDAAHPDNPNNTTTKGTPLDVSHTYEEIVKAVCEFYVYSINLALSRHPKVIFWNRAGNHDRQTSLAYTLFLKAWFRNEPRVTFGNFTMPADYMRHGKVLIASTHGDQHKALKPERLMSTMACDQPNLWGESEYRVWHVGHVHHDRKIEVPGGEVWTHRTLIPSDKWHFSEQWRSGRSMKKIVYHKRFGEVSTTVVNPAMLRA